MIPEKEARMRRFIFACQLISLSLIWIFFTGIAIWIVNLIQLSLELNDAPGASIGISIVAIPVFFTLASILTYVFTGLQQEEKRLISDSSSERPE